MKVWRYWLCIALGAAASSPAGALIGNGHPNEIWPLTMGCLVVGGVTGWTWESANLRRNRNEQLRVWRRERAEFLREEAELRKERRR